jgi:hypothetical protein
LANDNLAVAVAAVAAAGNALITEKGRERIGTPALFCRYYSAYIRECRGTRCFCRFAGPRDF